MWRASLLPRGVREGINVRGGKSQGGQGNEVPHVIWLMMRFKSDGVFVLVFVFARNN